MIFQIFQKSRIRMILIFCISENVTGSERNRNLRYLTSIWGQFWEKIFFDIIWCFFDVFKKVICGFFVEISTRIEISTTKIFEKKVENVFYTACKYHEDWFITFENIAKWDRSFFIRPHSTQGPRIGYFRIVSLEVTELNFPWRSEGVIKYQNNIRNVFRDINLT